MSKRNIKVGQEFCRCYPTHMWISEIAWVGIKYQEFKITKINDKSIRVAEKIEENKFVLDRNWNNEVEKSFHTAEEMRELVKKNSPNFITQYSKTMEKYTKKAFEYWYLKAQRKMFEIILGLAKNNKLTIEGVKEINPQIEKENKFLQKKKEALE